MPISHLVYKHSYWLCGQKGHFVPVTYSNIYKECHTADNNAFSPQTGCHLMVSLQLRCIFQPSSVHGWTSVFLLDVLMLCGTTEGD